MPSRAADTIVLDTLGKLYAHGHGIGGYCPVCQRVFAMSLPALIKERGGDCRYVGMKPLTCPGCQGRRTTFQITAPPKAAAEAFRGLCHHLPRALAVTASPCCIQRKPCGRIGSCELLDHPGRPLFEPQHVAWRDRGGLRRFALAGWQNHMEGSFK